MWKFPSQHFWQCFSGNPLTTSPNYPSVENKARLNLAFALPTIRSAAHATFGRWAKGGDYIMQSVGGVISEIVSSSFVRFGSYLPQFFAGLVILGIGLFVAALLKRGLKALFKIVRFDSMLESAHIAPSETVKVWLEFLTELIRWTIILMFLVPAVETWGIGRVTEILNQLLLYLPNVFIAVVVGFIGFVIANLVHDGVLHSVKGMGVKTGGMLATVARYSLIFFTTLIVLHQLGVAADLIRILFTGIVAMLALAGGLAFGLGGQETAREILKDLAKRLKK